MFGFLSYVWKGKGGIVLAGGREGIVLMYGGRQLPKPKGELPDTPQADSQSNVVCEQGRQGPTNNLQEEVQIFDNKIGGFHL